MQDINELHKDAPIAVYLRKSRIDDGGNEEETLRRHKQEIDEFIKKHGFTNVTFFEEVVSGEKIRMRPKMLELLDRISEGEFRIVVSVHIDRMTRGDLLDRAIMIQAFKESNTLLYSTSNSKTYDFNTESNDSMLTELELMFSNMEYKTIKRRLNAGKQRSLESGITQNKPPFGYYKDRNTDEILINKEEADIYRYIVDRYLNHGYAGLKIANELNRNGIKSPANKSWTSSYILTMLKNPYYIGQVVRGRTKTTFDKDGNPKRKTFDPSQYKTYDGKHDAIIDESTYQRILDRIEENRNVAPASLARTNKLSGLIRCKKCGYSLGIRTKKNVAGETYHTIRNCRYPMPDGTFCKGTRGINQDVILEALRLDMARYKEELFEDKEVEADEPVELKVDPIAVQNKRIEESESIVERAKKLFVIGDITFEEYESIKQAQEKAQADATAELDRLSKTPQAERETRRRAWKNVDIEAIFFEEVDTAEFNRIIRELVEEIRIFYDKNNELDVEIKYK